MDHARTIAMATTLLADGRAEDVADMVEPLLTPVTAPAASTGQILLRGVLARVEATHRNHPDRALDLLPAADEVSDLCTCVRADVALWRGWAHVRRSEAVDEATQGLRLLKESQELFASICDPVGRSWALLGQAEAYDALGEYGLLHRVLDDASGLLDRLQDTQAEQWLHELRRRSPAAGPDEETPPAAGTDPSTVVDGFVAESREMQAVAETIQQIQPSQSPVLITGEGGAGKRLVARTVHATSPRADGPIKHISCDPTQAGESLEAQLFGAEGSSRPGAVQAADGGTLVIEDVDALPPSLQSSLLDLLDAEAAPTAGEADGEPADVRVVATTTADLGARVDEGRFRSALRNRLRVITLHVPPLRERRPDIPLLARHFLNQMRPEGSSLVSITQPAMEALLRYNWPGNVRQLRNEIERALVHVQSEPAPTITLDMLLDTIVEHARDHATTQPSPDPPDAILEPDRTLSDVLSRTEKAIIERVLQACDGQVTASADVLGLTRQGLYKKMKRLGVDASAFQTTSEPTPAS
ncbi:sigma 54-interacting transcriptional regulator [Salinibacter altiplanensis]|uniref:sigma 54-interacting transcriptional regulator n=1 Tax=Salinibacter altiplanensis TaxID=1803181 RepID=UPI000C9F29FE|nr:sigma 54-interacting transcriptional regulator [Salinibacter altiplanensis]